MYGLGKEKKAPFEFDLEKEIKADPTKGRELLKVAEERVHKLKNLLRQGTGAQHFDDLGILLHGYTAFQRVLNRIVHKK